MSNDYDVIVVGARVAGASTAMLLARQGHRVLLLDRATMPSDTVSTHALLRSGVAATNPVGAGRSCPRRRDPADSPDHAGFRRRTHRLRPQGRLRDRVATRSEADRPRRDAGPGCGGGRCRLRRRDQRQGPASRPPGEGRRRGRRAHHRFGDVQHADGDRGRWRPIPGRRSGQCPGLPLTSPDQRGPLRLLHRRRRLPGSGSSSPPASTPA